MEIGISEREVDLGELTEKYFLLVKEKEVLESQLKNGVKDVNHSLSRTQRRLEVLRGKIENYASCC